MMIIMPAFPEGDQATKVDIVPLYSRALDMPIAVASIVCKITDKPVSENGYGDAAAHAPKNKTPATDKEENQPNRYLLQHRACLQYAVELGAFKIFREMKIRLMFKV